MLKSFLYVLEYLLYLILYVLSILVGSMLFPILFVISFIPLACLIYESMFFENIKGFFVLAFFTGIPLSLNFMEHIFFWANELNNSVSDQFFHWKQRLSHIAASR